MEIFFGEDIYVYFGKISKLDDLGQVRCTQYFWWQYPVKGWQLMSWFSLGFTHPLMVIGSKSSAIKNTKTRPKPWQMWRPVWLICPTTFCRILCWRNISPRLTNIFFLYILYAFTKTWLCFNDICSSLYAWIAWVTTRELFILVGNLWDLLFGPFDVWDIAILVAISQWRSKDVGLENNQFAMVSIEFCFLKHHSEISKGWDWTMWLPQPENGAGDWLEQSFGSVTAVFLCRPTLSSLISRISEGFSDGSKWYDQIWGSFSTFCTPSFIAPNISFIATAMSHGPNFQTVPHTPVRRFEIPTPNS